MGSLGLSGKKVDLGGQGVSVTGWREGAWEFASVSGSWDCSVVW